MSSNFWPRLKEKLASGPDAINSIDCPICLRQLVPEPSREDSRVSRQALGLADDEPEHDTLDQCHGINIFPCAHIFGFGCSRFSGPNDNGCPLCKVQLVHRGCELPVEPFPLTSAADIPRVPLTLPEGGRLAPLSVLYRIHAYVHKLANQTFRTLLSKDIDPANFQNRITVSMRLATGGRTFTTVLRKDEEPRDVPIHGTSPTTGLKNIAWFQCDLVDSMNALIRQRIPTPATPTWDFLPVELTLGLDKRNAFDEVISEVKEALQGEEVDSDFDAEMWWAFTSAEQSKLLRKVMSAMVEPTMELMEIDEESFDEESIAQELQNLMNRAARDSVNG